eukprot:182554-Pelagomonas_calceolata.AAC.4
MCCVESVFVAYICKYAVLACHFGEGRTGEGPWGGGLDHLPNTSPAPPMARNIQPCQRRRVLRVTSYQPGGTDGLKQEENMCKLRKHVFLGGATHMKQHLLKVPNSGMAKCAAAKDKQEEEEA